MTERATAILANLNIAERNAMQLAAEEAILGHPQTVLLSPTGSGKTLAFLWPVWQLLRENVEGVQALVITPSRELALQVESVWKKMGTGFKVNTCYGGHAMAVEIKNLSQPPALLIGTPGRIADHLERGTFLPQTIHTVVLDEFDKSLSLGFHEEMSFILECLPRLKKRVLVSATAGVDIPAFTGMDRPQVLDFITQKTATGLDLKIVRSEQKDKLDSLFRLLCFLGGESCMVFCNHRDAVERIARHLDDFGIPVALYHGKLEQDERELALTRLRNGSTHFLICTDLGSRGLDIPEMKHVIHYQLPLKEEDFIHRNGRTARMHATGTAYLILQEEEKLPAFLPTDTETLSLPAESPLPPAPEWVTVYIGAGRKNKVNKVDVVGFLSQKGKLTRDDLGLIEVRDFAAFAAVKHDKVKKMLALVRDEKIKGKKYKVALAK